MSDLPLCGPCCHSRDLAASHGHPYVECLLCRSPTSLRVPREIVVRIVDGILERVRKA